MQVNETDIPDACKVARALGVPAALRSAVWRVAQVAGQTAAPLRAAAAAALGEGSTGAGGAGVLAHGAVIVHLTRGVTTTGDSRAGVPALVTRNIIQNFRLPGLDRCPADLLIPFAGMNRQDLCLDVIVMASVKANISKQGAVEPVHAANKPSLEMERD